MLIDKTEYNKILNEIIKLVEKSKTQLAVQVNSALTLTFWNIGKIINTQILKNKRAEYGKQIVVTLLRQLS